MPAIRLRQEKKTAKALRGRADVLNKEENIHAGVAKGSIKIQPVNL